MAKLTREDLAKIKQDAVEAEKNWIKVGYSSCGIAAGAQEIFNVLREEARKHNADIEQKPYYPYSTPNSVFHKLPTMVYQNGKSSFWQCQG